MTQEEQIAMIREFYAMAPKACPECHGEVDSTNYGTSKTVGILVQCMKCKWGCAYGASTGGKKEKS